MVAKDKYQRFQRVAQERRGHVLESIQALGCCSDPASYAYGPEALPPIFRDIVEKLAEVWYRLSHHSPYPFIPFRLEHEAELEIGTHRFRLADMAPMAEVIALLIEEGRNFTALEPIRNRYADQFGNELCWSYPLCIDNHLGCVLLPVQEGILYLPYTGLDSETYEQIDTNAAGLLTIEKARELMDQLFAQAMDFYSVLTDIRRSLPTSTPPSVASREENGTKNV